MATKFEFLEAFDYEIRSPKGALLGVVNYQPGMVKLVPEEHAEAALARGAGRQVDDPKTATSDAGEGEGNGKKSRRRK